MTTHDCNVKACSAFFINSVFYLYALQLLDYVEMSVVDSVIKAVEPLRVCFIDRFSNGALQQDFHDVFTVQINTNYRSNSGQDDLLSNSAGKHEWSDVVVREAELESISVLLPHDIHVD